MLRKHIKGNQEQQLANPTLLTTVFMGQWYLRRGFTTHKNIGSFIGGGEVKKKKKMPIYKVQAKSSYFRPKMLYTSVSFISLAT